MSGDSKNSKTQIIVAIIGLIGILGGALFANWQKVFPPEPTQVMTDTNENIISPVPSRNESKLEKSVSITAKKESTNGSESIIETRNTARQTSDGRWDWAVYLDADQSTLSEIDCVEYTLHPTFPNPVRKVCDSTNGFELSSNGWGTFNVKIKVMFKDGRTKKLNHMLIF